jgi:hypothetical protein
LLRNDFRPVTGTQATPLIARLRRRWPARLDMWPLVFAGWWLVGVLVLFGGCVGALRGGDGGVALLVCQGCRLSGRGEAVGPAGW